MEFELPITPLGTLRRILEEIIRQREPDATFVDERVSTPAKEKVWHEGHFGWPDVD